MHRLLALAVLAGCDAVFGLTRAAIPPVEAAVDGPPLDTVDAPALANHDEDGDGRDDAIDVCPNIADAQVDADHDGVGDLCDPHPTRAIDRRYYFSSFQQFTGWTIVTGTWSPLADAVRVTTTLGDQMATLDGGFVQDPTMIAVIEQPTDPSGGGMDYGVMLTTVEGSGPFPPGIACYVFSLNGDLYIYDNRQPVVSDKIPYGPVPAVTVIAQSATDQAGVDGPPLCKGRDANGLTAMLSVPVPVVTAAIPALYAFDGAVTFKSVFVVARR